MLSLWSNVWQLNIAVSKCALIDIGYKMDYFFVNTIGGELLKSVDEMKDLGVMIDNKLSFSSHIAQIVAKAKQRTFLIFRAFRTRDRVPLLVAFKSFILPIVTYCSSTWSPHLFGDIQTIESIQRLFTRKLTGLEKMTYPERLKILNLPSLELRRLRADLLMCFKILNGYVAGDLSNYSLSYSNTGTRGHAQKLFVEHSKVDVRSNYFGNRIVKPWNSLPAEVINSPSVESFKKRIAKCDLGKFLSQFKY